MSSNEYFKIDLPTNYSLTNPIYKQNLALDNPEGLIWHKTETNYQIVGKLKMATNPSFRGNKICCEVANKISYEKRQLNFVKEIFEEIPFQINAITHFYMAVGWLVGWLGFMAYQPLWVI